MQITDFDITFEDFLAIEFEIELDRAVCRGMRRPHLQRHHFRGGIKMQFEVNCCTASAYAIAYLFGHGLVIGSPLFHEGLPLVEPGNLSGVGTHETLRTSEIRRKSG